MNKWDIGFWPTKTDAVYRSGAIDPSDINGPFRMMVRRNKYHHKGDRKPVYIGCMVPVEDAETQEISTPDISTLKHLIVEANSVTSTVVSLEESVKIANEYWRQIIEEIENLTDEKININIWGPTSGNA